MNEHDYFWRLVNTPIYWQEVAREFVCSANILKKEYRSVSPLGLPEEESSESYVLRQTYTDTRAIIVLYSLAIENLLKGIIVALGKDPIGHKGNLEGWFATHDLNKLAERAGVDNLDDQLLSQLTDFIKAGKYPVGLKDGEAFSAHNYFPEAVLAGIEKILPQLEERLEAVPTKRDKRPKIDLLNLCLDQEN